jgi:hypothetical protein
MMCVPAQGDHPKAGTPRLNETKFETQDYVITTHDVRDYGAVADDERDDAPAFQQAIDACERDGGGVIFAPAGCYDFRGRLNVKSGVYLRGEWRSPEEGPAAGTILRVYYGREQPDAEPFISMRYSCGLKDLSIWYPEQQFDEPVPYAWTIQQESGMSGGLENVTVYNAWQGIQAGPSGNQLMTVKNLHMTALRTGFLRDSVYDCQKWQKIVFSPRIWSESGLPGAPAKPAEYVALRSYLLKKSTGAILSHYDWTWMYDWTVEGFHTGIKTCRSFVKTEDRGPNGGFVRLKLLNNYVGMDVGDINRCGWADTEVLIRSSLKGAIGIKVRPGLKSAALFQNVTFEGAFNACVWSEASHGCVMMANCAFNNELEEGWGVYAKSGVIQLIQNTFDTAGNDVYIGGHIQSAALLGNGFAGAPGIENHAPKHATVVMDHSPVEAGACDLSGFVYPEAIHKPAKAELFNVRDFGALGDGVTDDSAAFARALKAAETNGGGTVYVPAGQFVLRKELVIPARTELRGTFDNCHHSIGYGVVDGKHVRNGQRGTELFAYPGKGDENGTPFIALREGASLRGVSIVYPEQRWSDYLKTKSFTPYPWTIQARGKNTRLKDVRLVNSFKGADFGTHESTGHRIDYLCGTVLKTGLYVDRCLGDGFVKNVQFNPSFWGWSKYDHGPGGKDGSFDVREAVKHTLTAFVFGYVERAHMLQNFSFASKTGIEFVKNPTHGGINGTLVAHGVDHSGASMIFHDVGNDAQFVNFQIVSMDAGERRRYLDIRNTVKGRAQFYSLLGWGHDPCAEIGIEQQGGDFYFLLSSFASFGLEYGIKQTGGTLKTVGMRFGEPIQSPIHGGYTSGLYGCFGEDIGKAEVIGAIKKKNPEDREAFIRTPEDKVFVKHLIWHDGY